MKRIETRWTVRVEAIEERIGYEVARDRRRTVEAGSKPLPQFAVAGCDPSPSKTLPIARAIVGWLN